MSDDSGTPEKSRPTCRRCEPSTDLCLGCAARYLGMSPGSMTRITKARAIAFYRYPFGGKRISLVDLEAFKARHRQAADAREAGARRIPPTKGRGVSADDREIARRLALRKLGRAS